MHIVKLMIALTIGTGFIWAALMFSRKWYSISRLKCTLLAPIITGTAYFSSQIMFFIENGSWGGASIFGGVLLMPLWSFPLSKIFRLTYKDTADICAPAGCAALAVMKGGCLLTGCCKGRVIYWTLENVEIRFPSQLVELCASLILLFITYLIIDSGKYRGTVYPRMMILYGSVRFILNLLRETKPFIWKLPAGNFWSLVSIVCGFIAVFTVGALSKRKAFKKKI